MNFDELKSQWNQESIPNQFIPQLEKSLHRAGNAIDSVRKNMKKDFCGLIILFVIGLAVLIIVPQILFVHKILLYIAWSFFLTFLILTGYFLFKFYRFYKKSYTLSYSMKDSLWWFYYELRSFIDFYYTFNVVSLTMGLSCGLSLGFIGASLKFTKGEENIISTSMDQADKLMRPMFLVVMVIFLLLSMVGMHYMVRYMYGKHLKQLKVTLDLLREEE